MLQKHPSDVAQKPVQAPALGTEQSVQHWLVASVTAPASSRKIVVNIGSWWQKTVKNFGRGEQEGKKRRASVNKKTHGGTQSILRVSTQGTVEERSKESERERAKKTSARETEEPNTDGPLTRKGSCEVSIKTPLRSVIRFASLKKSRSPNHNASEKLQHHPFAGKRPSTPGGHGQRR